MDFLPQLFRKELGVFDFISPAGSHSYVSCLMSILPEFKHILCQAPVVGRRGAEGEGEGLSCELGTLV